MFQARTGDSDLEFETLEVREGFMKRIILCIEDDIYKTACMKNCAEARFHLEVSIQESKNEIDLLEKMIAQDADEIMYLPHEGVDHFLDHLKDCGANRLNTEIRILLCQQFESSISKVIKDTVTEFAGKTKHARSKLRRAHRTGPVKIKPSKAQVVLCERKAA